MSVLLLGSRINITFTTCTRALSIDLWTNRSRIVIYALTNSTDRCSFSFDSKLRKDYLPFCYKFACELVGKWGLQCRVKLEGCSEITRSKHQVNLTVNPFRCLSFRVHVELGSWTHKFTGLTTGIFERKFESILKLKAVRVQASVLV